MIGSLTTIGDYGADSSEAVTGFRYYYVPDEEADTVTLYKSTNSGTISKVAVLPRLMLKDLGYLMGESRTDSPITDLFEESLEMLALA